MAKTGTVTSKFLRKDGSYTVIDEGYIFHGLFTNFNNIIPK